MNKLQEGNNERLDGVELKQLLRYLYLKQMWSKESSKPVTKTTL